MIENNEFDRIEELVKEAVEIVRKAGRDDILPAAAGHRPLTSSVIRDGEETRRATARTLC